MRSTGSALRINGPVNVPPASASLVPINVVSEVEKLGSLPNAVANSPRVSNTSGEELINSVTAVLTYCVEAICVVLTPGVAVGAVGVPLRSTDGIIELDLALIIGIFYILFGDFY
jgi:hypothetical protein